MGRRLHRHLEVIVCAFGDSFVNGKGDGSGLGWVGRVCASARRRGRPVVLHNLGIPRNTSLDVAARWRAEAEARQPALLLFSFGTNDAVQGIAPESSLAVAAEILTHARAWVPTLMIGPPPVCDSPQTDAAIAGLSAGLGHLCGRLGVPYLPVIEALLANDIWRAEAARDDGSHPDAGGYGVLAELVENWEGWRQALLSG